MTAVGRFSLLSETGQNPSIPTFFVALVGHKQGEEPDKGMTLEEFETLWYEKQVNERHDRFVSRVDTSSGTHEYFEV